MRTWLVLDTHFLCHRAFHMAGDMEWKGKVTGVIFGFLKSLTFLKDEFQTDNVAFCFEGKTLHRKTIYPAYKEARRNVKRTPEEVIAYQNLAIQISELRKRYLPKIGFKNIFCWDGMESDDIMAAIAQRYGDTEEVILVTSDADLFQCLRPGVTIYSPSKQLILTHTWFEKTYGITPATWAKVKAIAGCSSDGVKGVGGVGELTALKYLRGELSTASKAHRTIASMEGRTRIRLNRRLVQLPYEGCPKPSLVEDALDERGWREVCSLLGFRSIASSPPVATRRRGRHGKRR